MVCATNSPQQLIEQAAETCRALSAAQVRFMDFIARRPEALQRSSFGLLDAPGVFQPFPLQSWPVFVSRRRMRQMGRAATQIVQLVKSLPRRLFDNDPARISSYYGISLQFADWLLREPTGIEEMLARGDFVLTSAGLRCLEINLASHLGGWQSSVWAGLYRQIPLLSEFMRAHQLKVECRNTVRLALGHVIRTALRRRQAEQGPVNLAVLIPSQLESGARGAFQDFMQQQFSKALQGERVASGRVQLCRFEQLGLDRQRLHLPDEGAAVDAVIDLDDRRPPDTLFHCFKAGNLELYNNPISRLLSDKRNLALLWENAERFDPAQAELIKQLIPWTCAIQSGEATRAGERLPLSELLLSRRQDLVVKKAASGQGRSVHVGRFTPQPQWDRIVERAFDEGDWVVQDYVESLPFPAQASPAGCLLCDVVWGLFSFGGAYGGGFLSFQPQGEGGVVNVHKGASQGILLEVDEPQ